MRVAAVAAAASRAAVSGVDGQQQQPRRRRPGRCGRRARARPPATTRPPAARRPVAGGAAPARRPGRRRAPGPATARSASRTGAATCPSGSSDGQARADQPDVGDRLAARGPAAGQHPAGQPAGVGRGPGRVRRPPGSGDGGQVGRGEHGARRAGRRRTTATGTVGGAAAPAPGRRRAQREHQGEARRAAPAATCRNRCTGERGRRKRTTCPCSVRGGVRAAGQRQVVDAGRRCGRAAARRRPCQLLGQSAALDRCRASRAPGRWRGGSSTLTSSLRRRPLPLVTRTPWRAGVRRSAAALAAVGPVEARALEDDADRAVDLAHRGAALRALGHRGVAEGLHDLELVLALGVGAGVLVRGHGGGLPGRVSEPGLALAPGDCQ